MKKVSLFLLIFAALLSVQAQKSPQDDFFALYAGVKGFKTVVFGPKMLEMAANADGEKPEVLVKIKGLRVLSTENTNPVFVKNAMEMAEKNYELISANFDGEETTNFYLKEISKDEKSFLMIAHRSDQEIVMEISGDFDVTDISQLSKLGTPR